MGWRGLDRHQRVVDDLADRRLLGRCSGGTSARSGRDPEDVFGAVFGIFGICARVVAFASNELSVKVFASEGVPRRTAPAGNCLPNYPVKSRNRRMGLIILILVILLLIGAFPTGGYGYGYRSHGIIGTILIIVLILYLLGRL